MAERSQQRETDVGAHRAANGGDRGAHQDNHGQRKQDIAAERDRGFRDLLQALPAAVYTTDARGYITFFNHAAVELAGRTPALDDRWCVTPKMYWPDGTSMPLDQSPMATALNENRPMHDVESLAERPNGTRIRFLSFATPLHSEQGAVTGGVNMLIDLTQHQQVAAEHALMEREVDHRANNLLAVTLAMIHLTRANTVDEFKSAVEGRVRALAHAHALISSSRWAGADLHQLIEEELAPYRHDVAGRFAVNGPALRLPPALAQSLAVALHELATNAAQYGALSVRQGRVAIGWELGDDGQLLVRWSETSGPAVKPPTAYGFGVVAVDTMMAHLNGKVSRHWEPQGLICEICIPAEELTRRN